jgi:hypothetical protein
VWAGKLRARLEHDKRRFLRRMENRYQDMILDDGPGWWLLAMRWIGWSEVSKSDVRIRVNMEEVLLGGKPL